MSASQNKDKDLDKNKQMAMFEEQLEKQMKNIKDDLDVEHIKEILLYMDQIDPIEPFEQENSFNYNKNILPIASIEKKKLHSRLKKERANYRRFLVYRTACIALIAVFILNIGTVAFAGFSIFDPIISWTKEIFTIKNNSAEDKTLSFDYELGMKEYENFNELEKDLGFSLYKPSDVYKITSITVDDMEQKTFISLTYNDAFENSISCMISIYKNQNVDRASYIEQNEDDVATRKENINGIDFYVIKNTDWYSLAWLDGNLEYVVYNFNDEESAINFAESIDK